MLNPPTPEPTDGQACFSICDQIIFIEIIAEILIRFFELVNDGL